MQLTPSTGDVEFMKTFTVRLIGLCEFGFQPPYAVVMNLFQHSYVAHQFDEGLSVAIRTIVLSTWKQNGVSVYRRTFEECLRRHWVKLCEIVLCQVSGNTPQLRQLVECLFTATNMIGKTCDDFNSKPEKKASLRNKKSTPLNPESAGKRTAARNLKLTQGMLIEKVVANLYLAYALVSYAGTLNATTDKQSERKKDGLAEIAHGTPRRARSVADAVATLERLTEQQKNLYEAAITFVSRAFAVKNFTSIPHTVESYTYDYNFIEFMQRSLK
jgi:hypothetical protein